MPVQDPKIVLAYYGRKDVQKAIALTAKNKEIAVKFGEKGFGKRPDVIEYPNDVLEFAKKGATSFHCSEELWSNPLNVQTGATKRESDVLRVGWDLVIDIDCKWLEYSGIAADLLIKAIKYHGINSVTCKFSGNHGFHIGVPFKAFPERVYTTETKNWFPDGAKAVALYLKHLIEKPLSEGILAYEDNDIDKIIAKTGKPFEELVKNGMFDAFAILEIDTILISARHLYRMPYSLNEKSGLVSVVINPDKVLDFRKEFAQPMKTIIGKLKFLDDAEAAEDEARRLLIQAFDFITKQQKDKIIDIRKEDKVYSADEVDNIQEKIPRELFPPCIKQILNGLEDGRKRAMFALINFLTCVGWNYDEIEELMTEWNKKNKEPLREVLIKGHIRYHQKNAKKVLPPNCSNKAYFVDLGLCCPDDLCRKIRNPVNYSIIKAKMLQEQKNENEKKGRRKKKDENAPPEKYIDENNL